MFAPTLKNVLIVYGILTAYAFHDFKEINNTLRPSINQNNVIVPTLNPIGPFCVGEAPPSLPPSSLEGISGTWIPPVINNTATTDYTFTPNLTLHPTAEEVDLRIVINERIEPTFDLVGPICAGDILSPLPITSNEGIQGSWTPSVINNTMTTTYIFTPNLDECARSTSLSIFVRQLDITPTFDIISPVCAEAIPILRTVSNEGIIGSWDPPTIDVTRSRTYIFQPVSDPNQCAGPTNLYIEILSSGSVTPDFAPIDAICAGDLLAPLPPTSTNGITGTWSPVLNNMMTTEYMFTPNDPNQCATSQTLTIVVNPIVTPNFALIDPICAGDSLAPLPTTSLNGITGTWSPALDNTKTTAYIFTSNDPDQCATPQTLTIVVNSNVTPIFDSINPICVGDSLAPLPTTSLNGITGTWSPALDNTMTTDYMFTPNDPNQCATTQTLTIVVNPIVTPNFALIDPICAGDSLAPLPTTSLNGITGTWSPALNNTMTTEYTFTPNSILHPCSPELRLTITVHPDAFITPDFTPIDAICAGDPLAPLPTTSLNGITGSWSPTLDNTITTDYTFTPNDPNQCATTQTLTIVVNPIVTPDFAPIDAICAGDPLEPLPTTSLNGITGTWSPPLNNIMTTEYTFTPNDPDHCATSETMTINVNTISSLAISVKNLSKDFDTNQIIMATATGGSGTYEFRLNGGLWQSNPIFENLRGCNEHIVSVRDAMGCSNEPQDSITILEYPKFFTPNNDGYNDTWNIKCLRNDPLAVVTIFDRYGKVLERFKPSQNSWNGLYNGLPLLSTDYWFLVEYVKTTGEILTKKGHFSLKR